MAQHPFPHGLWRGAMRSVQAAALGLALAAPPAHPQAEPAGAEAAAQHARQARQSDIDTLLALTSEGAVLYAQDEVKLDGYQYCSQAVALAEAGEFRQSIRAASKALHLAQAQGDENLQALAQRDLAIVYNYSGRTDKAIEFARAALALQAKDPQVVQGPAHKIIGDVRLRQGDALGAVISYEQALQSSSARYAPLVRVSLAQALIEAGETARARGLLDAMEPPQEAALAAQFERTRARLLLAEGQPAQARALYQAQTRRSAGTDSAYYQFWAWDGVAQSALALGEADAAQQAWQQALRAIESVRARFRSEEFKMGLFSDVQEVYERALRLHAERQQPEQAFEISEQSRARALLDAVRGRTPLPTETLQAPTLAGVQAALRSDERLLQYHSLPTHLLVWVVGPQSLRMHRIELGREALAEAIEAYRNALVRGRRSAIAQADRLGQALLAPLDLPAGTRLVIAPHGPLHYLPFQSLRVAGRYAIEQHPIAVVPSAGVAVQLAQRAPRAAGQLTAFGNPRIADRYDLPGAEAEVRQLARLFPRNRVFTGTQATKTQFREAVAAAPVVHVAAHAEADAVDPLYSRILLANEGGRQNFLEAHEILALRMPQTALVTLSACESGLGRVARGDEVLGFPRSFLSAGSSGLIVSLWPVSDEATELLMGTLYRELARGQDVQRAMQAAQQAVLAQPAWAHPFFWAPFNLVGHWRLTLGGE